MLKLKINLPIGGLFVGGLTNTCTSDGLDV